ncbi:MAG: serine hydrolase, partial [Firmicutes bacterium]|nr:serine hydrolase [Bacillota bacterium]
MRWMTRFISVIGSGLIALGMPTIALAAPLDNVSGPPVQAKAAELMDASSGQVLYAYHAQKKLPMASVTKLMTLYLAVKAVQSHRLSLQSMVPADDDAFRTGGSQIWLRPGEQLTVNQLLTAIAVGSANDAAVALGDYLAGSPQAFVHLMNQTAASLGMKDTHFVNPHGLHD